ncbi:TPA: hypothetical protein L1241_004180 [Escherichia coli]|nr:hypothetical protein [Escherichia coli]HBN1812401.1 hypothetical protein [Escherichia coli]HBN2126209.1 hypothetical protein [Escherichia coli]
MHKSYARTVSTIQKGEQVKKVNILNQKTVNGARNFFRVPQGVGRGLWDQTTMAHKSVAKRRPSLAYAAEQLMNKKSSELKIIRFIDKINN